MSFFEVRNLTKCHFFGSLAIEVIFVGLKRIPLYFVVFFWGGRFEYNNNVHFEGVRFICGPHLAIIGPSEARADLMPR